MMVWVNIDKPTKTYTIHGNTACYHVLKIRHRTYQAEHKGVNELKRDGGWIEFDSLTNAHARQQLQYPDYTLVEHC